MPHMALGSWAPNIVVFNFLVFHIYQLYSINELLDYNLV